MTSLYSRLADQWDKLFPPDAQRISFLSGLFEKLISGARIIEVGCGSGATAISLASLGHTVAASDRDNDMIQVAEKAAGESSSSAYYPESGQVRFSVDDMISALEKAPAHSAHAVLCLGNTLPHLTRNGELDKFFQLAGAALSSGGVLVIQMLNYPRIVASGGVQLPDLEGDGLTFRRKQSFDSSTGFVVFDTEVESGGLKEQRSHNLNPLDIENLQGPAVDAGFENHEVFRDWQGTEFTADASWLVSTYRYIGESL